MRMNGAISKPAAPVNALVSFRQGETAVEADAPALDEVEDQAELYDERATNRAWEAFLSCETPSSAMVRGIIERSWRRSATLGVDARGRGSTQISTADDLLQLRDKNEDLLGSATQTFRRLAEVLGDAATMVVITDNQGTILDVSGDRRIIDAGHDIRLEIGAAWNESVTGTNGIGTALVTGQPVHVHAAEHFCEGVKAWTCAGAPIRNPMDGSIIGIIDFSGPEEIFHSHNVALAAVAANHIELALCERIRIERMRLLEACLERMPGIGRNDGFVIVDRFGRIVHHNDLAQLRWRSLAKLQDLRVGARLFGAGAGDHEGLVPDLLPEGLRNQGFETLVVDGTVKGAVVVLGTKPRPKGAAARPSACAPSASLESARAAIVGRSPALLQAMERAERVARGKTAILLDGETGVGKELFARLIHAASQETGREPFVAINCGAVSKELLGAELFGHAPGAFTGATREGRPGRFEVADGGVLSLDEIGEMPLDLQPYLLRVLEERVVYRLGEAKPRQIDVRLVASTNRNLKQEVAEGRFRKDLYFRIGAIRLTIPPLRERRGDIDILIDHFNREFSTAYDAEPLRFDAGAMELLRRYDWPGNVRELRNMVENLALMSTSRSIGVEDFPEDFVDALVSASAQEELMSDPPSDKRVEPCEIARLDDVERQIILKAVAAAGGNISLAAEKLGVSRSTLYRKMQNYRMQS